MPLAVGEARRAEPTVEVPSTVVAASAASAHQFNYVTSIEFRKLNFLFIETGTHDRYVRLVHLPLTRQGHVCALEPWASPFGLHPRLKAIVRYAARTLPSPLLTWSQ